MLCIIAGLQALPAIITDYFMWTELRQNIETIRRESRFSEDEFKPVDIISWKQLQDNIISTFCKIETHKDKFNWLWEDFKQDTYSVRFEKNYPFDSLLQLVDASEQVWLVINESVNDGTKFWFYEGQIKPIAFVLGKSFADEVYIVSKRYDWLLCINHHDVLFATGLNMPGKLKQLDKQNKLLGGGKNNQ